ncbi:MAG: LicD family protein [Candidatus Cloacimonetes bacterium]|nr:LicD family protein [Candidatus Cloacimonadota bacterium]
MKQFEPIQSKLVQNTFKILRKHNIPFWLESGTLLGIIRDKKNIPRHRKLDIGIPGEYHEKFISLKKDFSPFYRLKPMVDRSGRRWIDTEFPRVKVLKGWEKHRKASLKINVTFKYKKENKFRWIDKRSCKWVSSHFFDELEKINYLGKEYPVPSDTENYLTARYGDWKKVQKYWISGIDDLSIVPDEIIKKVPSKKRLRGYKKRKKKRVRLEGKYRERMKKIILDAIDILEKNNIPYWLDEGTLLGIIRDGDLLPWDHDADFGVPGEYAEKILKIQHKFFPKFFVKTNRTKNKWLPGRIRSVKLKTPFERIVRINFHIDLFFKYKINDRYHWIIMNALKHSKGKFFDKLDTITWEGRKVKIPSHVEEYLELNYGDWKTPHPDFDPSVESGTIAEKGF